MSQKEQYIEFDEYLRQGGLDKREKASIWQTAIGLQAVDGLKTSDYLKETARKHIEGDIDIDQARELIKTYYQSKTVREPDDDEKQEADKVSANITKILSAKTLDFSTKGYIALHRRIFEGVMKHAGELRKYDITKKEWVLENDTVNYLNWEDLRRAIDYDLEKERNFSYKGISEDAMIAHMTKFVSGLWQIHAFGEGNTRTTAVFTIQYLRSIGLDVNIAGLRFTESLHDQLFLVAHNAEILVLQLHLLLILLIKIIRESVQIFIAELGIELVVVESPFPRVIDAFNEETEPAAVTGLVDEETLLVACGAE